MTRITSDVSKSSDNSAGDRWQGTQISNSGRVWGCRILIPTDCSYCFRCSRRIGNMVGLYRSHPPISPPGRPFGLVTFPSRSIPHILVLVSYRRFGLSIRLGRFGRECRCCWDCLGSCAPITTTHSRSVTILTCPTSFIKCHGKITNLLCWKSRTQRNS